MFLLTPNLGRIESIRKLVEAFKIDGVIDLTWQFCHTYHIESQAVEQYVQKIVGIPFLHLVTDYAPPDSEQLRTRIEAFLEITNH